jgi:hypothetical protein
VQGLPRRTDDLEKAGIHITRLGDAGEMLDEQAKVTYRHRLSALREELGGAQELGNVARAKQISHRLATREQPCEGASGSCRCGRAFRYRCNSPALHAVAFALFRDHLGRHDRLASLRGNGGSQLVQGD